MTTALELPGFDPLDVADLQGSPAQVAWATRIREAELHLIRQWWLAADRLGDQPDPGTGVASWRGFARRHMFGRAQIRWVAWLTGRITVQTDEPKAEEIFARADAVELERIKYIALNRVKQQIAHEGAGWWIAQGQGEEPPSHVVFYLGALDPLPRCMRAKTT